MNFIDKMKKGLKGFWGKLGPDYPDMDDALLATSVDPIESTLANSLKEIDEKWNKHFTSTSSKRGNGNTFKINRDEIENSRTAQVKVEQNIAKNKEINNEMER